QRAQLRTQRESTVEARGEPLHALPLWRKANNLGLATGRRVSCNLALNKRFIQAANAGKFTHAGHALHGTLLRAINGNIARIDAAPEQARQLKVGHKMESAAEPVA